MNKIRQGTSAEPTLQASKWLKTPALLEVDEMSHLFETLGHFNLYRTGAVVTEKEASVSQKDFLTFYAAYIESLKKSILPEPATYQPWFSLALSSTNESFFSVEVGNEKQLLRICHPIIQLQAHTLDYSPFDKKFRSMVFGSESITWGILFSYPQIYLDAITKDIINTKDQPNYPNSVLFHSLQKWMRQHTIPTPFITEGIKYNVPMRLGKQCISWINRHPQLITKGLQVKTS